MSGSVNKVILVGNVGSQPEVRSIQSTGEELVTFSLATSEKWKDRNTGENKEKTDWHRIVVFSPGLVKIIKSYVTKGSKLYLEGKLQTREYQDSDGVKKYTTEVVLTQYNSALTLLDSKKDTFSTGASDGPMRYDQVKEKESEDLMNDDDIPF
ncbi:single-stranded DNA-binding protein [Candidatus Bandiella euplotis]|uniref:Single-stranded DNA-binding protein n=1 Tax=Candidatus Bandiella euplotis TaxID=1664265 RepID=A0ABZ0UMG6_9RICK|nr:single-stranded DNA-binding protein [Candidatus Bandiella woodruffii]WPX97329.1 Single-stranded DNA-binding protein [Candidatus Bandiella woodruffii]